MGRAGQGSARRTSRRRGRGFRQRHDGAPSIQDVVCDRTLACMTPRWPSHADAMPQDTISRTDRHPCPSVPAARLETNAVSQSGTHLVPIESPTGHHAASDFKPSENQEPEKMGFGRGSVSEAERHAARSRAIRAAPNAPTMSGSDGTLTSTPRAFDRAHREEMTRKSQPTTATGNAGQVPPVETDADTRYRRRWPG